MKIDLEISEALVARIDAIARAQKTSREMSVVTALRAWYAHPIICDFGDFQIHRDGPENTPEFKELSPATQEKLLGERAP
jgi:hypothetical protein